MLHVRLNNLHVCGGPCVIREWNSCYAATYCASLPDRDLFLLFFLFLVILVVRLIQMCLSFMQMGHRCGGTAGAAGGVASCLAKRVGEENGKEK